MNRSMCGRRIVGGTLVGLLLSLGCSVRTGLLTPESSEPDGAEVGVSDAPSRLIPLRKLTGLLSIRFYERTRGTAPDLSTFLVDSPELVTLGGIDAAGASGEFFDLFYSDADGSINPDGLYLTIHGVYKRTAPSGGGMNVAEVQLVFVDRAEFASAVVGYRTHGDNAIESSIPYCMDGNLDTATTMGNTVGTSEPLRLTLAFPSGAPPPGK